MPLMLDFDPTAQLPANFIQNESHVIVGSTTRYWVPSAGCFFTKGLVLRRVSDNYLLKPGIDYKALHFVSTAAEETGKEVCAIIFVHNENITGDIQQSYHAVGGQYSATVDALEDLLDNLAASTGEQVAWGQIVGAPAQYPPTPHSHNIADWYGLGGLLTKLEELRQAALQGDIATIQMIYQYIDNVVSAAVGSMAGLDVSAVTTIVNNALGVHRTENNAHSKAQVGLGSVPNWAPLSDSDATVVGATGKTTNVMNPAQILSLIENRVTKTWLGLENTVNFGVATNAAVDTGTAVNALITPAGTQRAISNIARTGASPTALASVTLLPFFSARFNDVNPPTDAASGGIIGMGIQFFQNEKGDVISSSTLRTQVVFISGGALAKGLWTRTHNGTSWSAFTPGGSLLSSGLSPSAGYDTATDAQALTGTATNLLMTPKAGRLSAFNALRFTGDITTANPNTTLDPVIISKTADCPTGAVGVTAGHEFIINTTFNPALITELNTVNTVRTQFAYGRNVDGVWRRHFNGTSWTAWIIQGTDELERRWANTAIQHADNFIGITVTDTLAVGAIDNTECGHCLLYTGTGVSPTGLLVGFNGPGGYQDTVIGPSNIPWGGGSGNLLPVKGNLLSMTLNNSGLFSIHRMSFEDSTAAPSGTPTSRLYATHFDGVAHTASHNLRLTFTKNGVNDFAFIDLIANTEKLQCAVARDLLTGTIGVCFTEYNETRSQYFKLVTNVTGWGWGSPLVTFSTDSYTVANQIGVTTRTLPLGFDSQVAYNNLSKFLRFSESAFGNSFIKAVAVGDAFFLIFSRVIVCMTPTMITSGGGGGGQLDRINITIVNNEYFINHRGPHGTIGTLLYATGYKRGNNYHLMMLDENGAGREVSLTPAIIAGSGTTPAFRSINAKLPTASPDIILDIGYHSGCIWAIGGGITRWPIKPPTGTPKYLAAVPFDYTLSSSGNVKLKAMYKVPATLPYQRQLDMYPTRLGVGDNKTSGKYMYVLGKGNKGTATLKSQAQYQQYDFDGEVYE